ncbi:MAG TPA: FAD-dependent oxidoreductase, partial [Rugosimonospora sp.]|nr:FAD-dependent oxidoreductase [Rugosimonospora sp.]
AGFVAHGGAPLSGPGVLRRAFRGALRPDGALALGRPARGDLGWLWRLHRARGEAAAGQAVLHALKNRSLALLPELAGDCFTVTGMLTVYRDPDAFCAAWRALPAAIEAGVPLRVVDVDGLRELEPGSRFDAVGAVYNPVGGYLRTPEFLTALAGRLRGMGVTIREHTPVDGVVRHGDRVLWLRTAAGVLHPEQTVFATGAGLDGTARLLDAHLPVRAVKGYSLTMSQPAGVPGRPVLLATGHVALRPSGGELRVGGGLELSATTAVSRRRVEQLRATVRAYLPEVTLPEGRLWTGYRPATPDSLPLLGRFPGLTNAWVAGGYGHVGMGLAPAAGELLAALVTGEPPDLPTAPLDPGRYW